MSGMNCAVNSCENSVLRATREGKCISFHRFPVDPDIRQAWIASCQRVDNFNPESSHVCSEHFDNSDFESDFQAQFMKRKSRRRLKSGVVPHLNIPKFEISHKNRIEHEDCASTTEGLSEPQPGFSSKNLRAYSTFIPPNPIASSETCSSHYQSHFNELQKMNSDLMAELVKEKRLRLRSEEKARLLKRSNQLLKKKLNTKLKSLSHSREIKFLEQQIYKLQKEINTLTTSNNTMKNILQFFSENEKKIISGENVTVRWTNSEIAKAFTLRYLSKRAYIYVRESMKYPLPGISSLQRWASGFDMKEGILSKVLEMMRVVGEERSEFEKLSVLLFDEMKVEKLPEYDVKDDEVFGPFSYLQVVMARGLCGSWKQPVYVGFDVKMTKEILSKITHALNKINYRVVAVVSDMVLSGNSSIVFSIVC